MIRRTILIVLFLVVGAGHSFGQTERTVWDGAYTAEQAMRGGAAYTRSCASCHAPDLRGDSNSPSIVGVSFTFLWGDMTLAALFNKIQSQMPPDGPNTLGSQAYLDILAFILEANQFPPGDEELGATPEALVGTRITTEPYDRVGVGQD